MHASVPLPWTARPVGCIWLHAALYPNFAKGQPTAWTCLSNNYAVRTNANSDVECMSTNAMDCLEDGCLRNVLAPPHGIKPLACGAAHAAVWDEDGYSSPAHWCAQARSLLNSTGWRCLPGLDVPLRLNAGGDAECMGNGTQCLWGNCTQSAAVPPAANVPMACGAMHQRLFGITGYERSDHWCSLSKAALGRPLMQQKGKWRTHPTPPTPTPTPKETHGSPDK